MPSVCDCLPELGRLFSIAQTSCYSYCERVGRLICFFVVLSESVMLNNVPQHIIPVPLPYTSSCCSLTIGAQRLNAFITPEIELELTPVLIFHL